MSSNELAQHITSCSTLEIRSQVSKHENMRMRDLIPPHICYRLSWTGEKSPHHHPTSPVAGGRAVPKDTRPSVVYILSLKDTTFVKKLLDVRHKDRISS